MFWLIYFLLAGITEITEFKETCLARSSQVSPLFAQAILFVNRVLSDHDTTPAQLRKPLGFREALGKHQACGGFLHYLRQLEKMAPGGDFAEMEKDLRQQFQYGYLDPDILHSLETMVPPGNIQMVSAFRTAS